jgi:hypothetical protein
MVERTATPAVVPVLNAMFCTAAANTGVFVMDVLERGHRTGDKRTSHPKAERNHADEQHGQRRT